VVVPPKRGRELKGKPPITGARNVPPDMKKGRSKMGIFSKANTGPRGGGAKGGGSKKGNGCFITEACVRAKGLPDDCYELALLRLFRAEYVAKLPDGEEALAAYGRLAPRVVAVAETLPPDEAQELWEDLYERLVRRSVGLITNGEWDAAYALYRGVCAELEDRFLATPPAREAEAREEKTG
jgi:hypothetical protein